VPSTSSRPPPNANRSAEARRVEDELRHRALHDDLTGLANRGLLTDRLEQAVGRLARQTAGSVAVLFADIDQFKLVNESWGHAAGDELLVSVGARLVGALRQGDSVARFGGDEFVVVCEDTDEEQARELADQLMAALAAPFDLDGQRVYVGASIGIAVSPPQTASDLLRFADAAMYHANTAGRGRTHVFDAALADESADRLELSNDFRDALRRDELALYYQPIIELATGRVRAGHRPGARGGSARPLAAPDTRAGLAGEVRRCRRVDRVGELAGPVGC
jgi:diguanylate cyclase (GGDEF)-like protein